MLGVPKNILSTSKATATAVIKCIDCLNVFFPGKMLPTNAGCQLGA